MIYSYSDNNIWHLDNLMIKNLITLEVKEYDLDYVKNGKISRDLFSTIHYAFLMKYSHKGRRLISYIIDSKNKPKDSSRYEIYDEYLEEFDAFATGWILSMQGQGC